MPDLKPIFAKDVGDWILERVGGGGASASATATKEPEAETAAPTEAAVTSEEIPAESGAAGTSKLPVEEHAKL